MGLFDITSINERAIVKEGNYLYWKVTVNKDTWVSLAISRIDGYGPTLYVIPSNEFNNYKQGRIFKHIPDFHFENIDHFDNNAILSRGSYYIITTLPSIPDDRESISEFNIRYEIIQ